MTYKPAIQSLMFGVQLIRVHVRHRREYESPPQATKYFLTYFNRKTALAETLMLMQSGFGCETETRG